MLNTAPAPQNNFGSTGSGSATLYFWEQLCWKPLFSFCESWRLGNAYLYLNILLSYPSYLAYRFLPFFLQISLFFSFPVPLILLILLICLIISSLSYSIRYIPVPLILLILLICLIISSLSYSIRYIPVPLILLILLICLIISSLSYSKLSLLSVSTAFFPSLFFLDGDVHSGLHISVLRPPAMHSGRR